MSYSYINFRYPKVRQEEYNLIKKCGITKATQFPIIDPLINLPHSNIEALSFISLHHKSDQEIHNLLLDNKYKIYHLFEIGINTKQAIFLDDFISCYKTKKHTGNYISPDKFNNVKDHKVFKYYWHLDKNIATYYLYNLFNLDKEPSLEKLKYLNYNGTTLDWELHYIQLGEQ